MMAANTVDFEQIAREAAEKKRLRETHDSNHKPGLSTIWADDIAISLDAGGVIDGLLSTTGLTVLYGESGAGKTFLALDMACHIAAGLPWRGMDVEQGVVIYVAAEAPESVKRRLWAWKHYHGVEHLPVLVLQSSVNLLNGDTEAVVDLVAQTARSHGRVAMVVIDTLARSMTGNENSPDDMGKYVDSCARIRAAAETHVLVIHHCGKDLAKGARGHSSLRAASDTELEITKSEAGGCLTVTKNRDEDEASGRFGFRLEPVELGVNAKGRTVTTCVAVTADVTVARPKGRQPIRMTDKGRIVVQGVEKAIKYASEKPPSHPETDGVTQAVGVKAARIYWRQVIGWDHLTDLERDRSRQDWKRGLENAVAAGAIAQWGEWLWLRA